MVKRLELEGAPWFARRIYSASSNWGAREWFLAISNRFALGRSIDNAARPESCAHAMKHFFAEVGSNLLMPGGLTFSEPGRTSSLFLARGDYKDLGAIALQSPVVETSVKSSDYWVKAWGKNFRLLAIDVAAPDEAIRMAFANWLGQLRKDQRKIGLVSDATFKAWTSSYALAYVDIAQYQRGSGKRFTQAQIADALFPDADVDRVEKLRKVTIKHAKRMLAPEFLARLAGQLGVDAPVFTMHETDSLEPAEPF